MRPFTLEWNEKFPEPKTIEEAQARRLKTVADVQAIQTQLGTTRRTHDDGTEYDYLEYAEWKRKAKVALQFSLAQGRLLKDWIAKETSQQRQAARPSAERIDRQVLGMAFSLLVRDCLARVVPPADSERDLADDYLDRARAHLGAFSDGDNGKSAPAITW